MNFIQYITMVLLSLQPAYSDKETWEERSTRMQIIATAIDDASSKATCSGSYQTDDCKKTWEKSKTSLGLLLVTVGFWESRFSKHVHEGKCKPYECDSYRKNGNVVHRARSPWQIQKTSFVSKEEYSKMLSSTLESTTISANVAVRYLVSGMNRCNSIFGAMSIYATAKTCSWSGARKRLAFYEKLEKKNNEQIIEEFNNQKIKLEKRFKNE